MKITKSYSYADWRFTFGSEKTPPLPDPVGDMLARDALRLWPSSKVSLPAPKRRIDL